MINIKRKKGLESILLLACRSPYLDDAKVYPPMGIMYLDAAIKRDLPNIKVEIDDDYNLNSEEGLEKFKDYDAIGVSIMTPQREEAHKILNAIKSRWPEKKMIAGGPHVLHYLEDIQKERWDYLVMRDGERDIIKILKGEAENRVLNDILMREELKQIPRPDRIGRKKFLEGYNYELKPGVKSTVVIIGRGCPMKCTFCEDAMTLTRWHEPELVDKELEDIKQLGYGAVYIPDDLPAINLKRFKPYMESMKKRDLIFRTNGHAKFMTDEFAKALAEHGCYELSFGAESGSQKILDNIRKETTVQQNYDCIRYATKYGIKTKAYLMIGLPGEDEQTLKENIEFIENSLKLGLYDFQISIYYPYKGTQIRDSIDKGSADLYLAGDIQVLREGLGAHTLGKGKSEAVLRTKALTPERLLEVREYIIKKYKPLSHAPGWNDKFRDSHLKSNVEYS
jgi:radical SAM superfamily enzyme YgiQ (UPF0313 family)